MSSRRPAPAGACRRGPARGPGEVSLIENWASSSTTRRSQASASWKPAPTACALHHGHGHDVAVAPPGERVLELGDRGRPPRSSSAAAIAVSELSPATPSGVNIRRSMPAENDRAGSAQHHDADASGQGVADARRAPARSRASARCASRGGRASPWPRARRARARGALPRLRAATGRCPGRRSGLDLGGLAARRAAASAQGHAGLAEQPVDEPVRPPGGLRELADARSGGVLPGAGRRPACRARCRDTRRPLPSSATGPSCGLSGSADPPRRGRPHRTPGR